MVARRIGKRQIVVEAYMSNGSGRSICAALECVVAVVVIAGDVGVDDP